MSEAVAEDRWLTTEEVAERFHIDPSTVRKWRRDGDGPKGWAVFGARTFRCRESAVIEFERAREEAFTAERERWAPVAS